MIEQFTGEEAEGTIVVGKEYFNVFYKMAEAVLSAQGDEEVNYGEEFAVARALTEALDEAIDSGAEQIIFTEKEVYCLSVLVQEEDECRK